MQPNSNLRAEHPQLEPFEIYERAGSYFPDNKSLFERKTSLILFCVLSFHLFQTATRITTNHKVLTLLGLSSHGQLHS